MHDVPNSQKNSLQRELDNVKAYCVLNNMYGNPAMYASLQMYK